MHWIIAQRILFLHLILIYGSKYLPDSWRVHCVFAIDTRAMWHGLCEIILCIYTHTRVLYKHSDQYMLWMPSMSSTDRYVYRSVIHVSYCSHWIPDISMNHCITACHDGGRLWMAFHALYMRDCSMPTNYACILCGTSMRECFIHKYTDTNIKHIKPHAAETESITNVSTWITWDNGRRGAA